MNQSLTTEEITENKATSEPFRGTYVPTCVPYYGKSSLQTTTRGIVRFPIGVITHVQVAGISSGKFPMGGERRKNLKVGVPFHRIRYKRVPYR
jgi:hypothetical protein